MKKIIILLAVSVLLVVAIESKGVTFFNSPISPVSPIYFPLVIGGK